MFDNWCYAKLATSSTNQGNPRVFMDLYAGKSLSCFGKTYDHFLCGATQ